MVSRAAVFVILLLLHAFSAWASPTITNPLVFTDNRPFDDPFGIFGYNLSLQAQVSDPFGVPNNISAFKATNLTTSAIRNINFAAGEQSLFPGIYTRFLPYIPAYNGVWQFSATNLQGQTTLRNSHNLDKPVQLALPSGITVTPSATGVQVNLNAVPGADRYALEVYKRTPAGLFGQAVFNSVSPSFSIPNGTLLANQNYVLRVRAENRDFTEAGGPMENRSVNAVEFSLEIPSTKGFFTTNTSLILGAVGVGLALLGFAAIPLGVIAIPAAALTTLKVVGLAVAIAALTNTVRIKLDPPDPDFAQPVVLRQVVLPQIQAGGALTPGLAATANQAFAAQATVANVLEAILTSLERYQGAAQAGDFTQSGNRLADLNTFVGMLDEASLDAANLVFQFETGLQSAGIDNVPVDIAQALADLTTNGFSPDVEALLASFGFDSSDIQLAEGLLLTGDPSTAPNTLFAALDAQQNQFQNLAAVPIPSSLLLVLVGLFLIMYLRRNNHRLYLTS